MNGPFFACNVFYQSCTSRNEISDDFVSSSYRSMHSIEADLDKYFHHFGLRHNHCVALYGGNNIVTLSVILWFLKNRNSIFIQPPSYHRVQREILTQKIPQFCSHMVTIAQTRDFNPSNLLSYLKIKRIESNILNHQTIEQGQYFIFKTSGSGGQPKLVRFPVENMLNNAGNCYNRYMITCSDRIMIPIPISHSFALIAGLLPALYAGASIKLIERVNVVTYLTQERTYKPNITLFTPGFGLCLADNMKEKRKYKLTISSGDRISSDHFRKIDDKFGFLINQYGSSEMGAIASSMMNDSLEVRAKGLLKPFPQVNIKLSDQRSNGKNEKPEILCQHKSSFDGYLDTDGNVTAPHQYIDWFRTGDHGNITTNGRFAVSGRCDNNINRNGILISCHEIEHIMLNSINLLSDTVVLAGNHQTRFGQELVAFCSVIDAKVSPVNIRKLCFDIMPRYAIPDHIIIIDTIPRLVNGKIDRQQLLRMINRD